MALDKCIVTLTTGDFHQRMSEITHPSIKAYADRVGADFVVWKESNKYSIPHYQKCEIRNLLKEYNRVLYIDTDIIVRDDAPDLFKLVPDNELGIFEEGRFVERKIQFIEYLKQINFPIKAWNEKYYNTGVMLASRAHADIFAPPPVEINSFYEQNYLNANIAFLKPKIHPLDYKFNRMSVLDQISGEERHDSYFLHYAGVGLAIGEDKLLGLIKDDLKVWENTRPHYRFSKNIAIEVQGGLGDQIDAEPVVRYIYNDLYRGDNIIVITHWPEIFAHLDLKVYKPGQKIENMKGFYHMKTMRSPDHVSWEYMSHPLIHGTDFASLQSIRSILPNELKRIRLKPELITLRDKVPYTPDVLLHPGRGWPSKTFPADIWQSYADILVDHGIKVGIIGKRVSAEQGVVEFDWSKCLDLVDKLSVSELFGIISQTPCLITNDSAPVHIAGAFDNYLGVIATCKHPEKIMPFRNGTQKYKARNLERYPMYDDYNHQPTQINGATIDKCEEYRLRECLPCPADILAFVGSSLKSV